MSLKPWYKVVTLREDLREGKPLDASEFAVHLDDVRNDCAPPDYQKPDRFFARTYLTKNLSTLASQVIRRLSGTGTEASALLEPGRQVRATRVEAFGNKILDRVRQSMIHFATGRSETLRRFLVKHGEGNVPRFWTLAQVLSTEEKRWVDGVLARKKGLRF